MIVKPIIVRKRGVTTGTVRKVGGRPLRVRVRAGTVHKGGVSASIVRKTVLWVLWVLWVYKRAL